MELPKLDIIIPQAFEDEATIKPLLNSIEDQVYVQPGLFEVTIVNDHTDKLLSEDFLKSYNYKINYLRTEKNAGSGATRQHGVDNTSNEYFMFMDADDRFATCFSLYIIYSSLQNTIVNKQTANVIETLFYEEVKIPEKNIYSIITHDKPNSIWLHGKVFRRAFIEEHNIRFHATLRAFEDTYYNKMVRSFAAPETQILCNQYTYFWYRNPKSISSNWNHDDRTYMYWRNDEYIRSAYDALKVLKPHYDKINLWNENIMNVILTTFFLFQTEQFMDSATETRIKVTNMYNMIIDILLNIIPGTFTADRNLRAKIYQTTRQEMIEKFNFMSETMTWNNFLSEIDKKCPQAKALETLRI